MAIKTLYYSDKTDKLYNTRAEAENAELLVDSRNELVKEFDTLRNDYVRKCTALRGQYVADMTQILSAVHHIDSIAK